MAKRIENKEPKQNETQVVYIGPTLKQTNQFAVLLGELPKDLQELKRNCKVAKNLIVSLDNYVQALEELKKKGSLIRTSFQKVSGYLREQRKG